MFIAGSKVISGTFPRKCGTHLQSTRRRIVGYFNPLNAELNPICHLLALLGAHHILHVSGVRVNIHGTRLCLIALIRTCVHETYCTSQLTLIGRKIIPTVLDIGVLRTELLAKL